MKRIFLVLVLLLLSVSILSSCDVLYGVLDGSGSVGENQCEHVDADDDYFCDKCKNSYYDGDESEKTPDDEKGDTDNGDNNEDDGKNDEIGEENKHTYTDFTAEEKELLYNTAGGTVPFIPSDEYYVESYYDEYYGETCVNYYSYGNTKEEFDAYYKLYSEYELVDSYEDDYGDTWYCFNGETYVELCYYYYEGENVVDVYVYTPIDDDDSGNTEEGGNGGTNDGDYLYTDFTSSEKALFIEYFGEVIPFFDCNEYYVEEYNLDYGDEYESGINYYVYGMTEAQFTLYRSLFTDYAYDGSDTDDWGDSWYYYTADSGFYIDMCYYLADDGSYVADVYVYFLYESGGEGGEGGEGGGEDITTPDNLITNAGAGLPSGNNGVYDVDFTDATNVKDVTDQGYYIDGCPTVGSPKVLVIPVDFSDINGRSNGYSISNIVRAFNGGAGETDYYSVHDYYYLSSYGKLDLDITVVNQWFVPKYDSSYYANATYDYYGDTVAIGDQLVMDEALAYLSTIMDLSEFDSDGNYIIDAVVLITTLEIDDSTDYNWAYRYWNIYTDDQGYYYEYDGVSANDYLWASYSFMHESYDEDGYADYTDTSVMNTYTFIHEFGHILGADDYYDTSDRENHPMEGYDVMDGMNGDHNAFTKFNLGWITTSRLVTADGSITLSLKAFGKSGDSIIIANNWDAKLGAYQEYYVIVYYTNEDLNSGEGGYFSRDGILVYHVNASLYSENYDGEIYYDVYNNNTDPSDQYGTADNLIEFVKSAEGNFTYVEGDVMPPVTDDQGNSLSYGFTVDSIDGDVATITFTKR